MHFCYLILRCIQVSPVVPGASFVAERMCLASLTAFSSYLFRLLQSGTIPQSQLDIHFMTLLKVTSQYFVESLSLGLSDVSSGLDSGSAFVAGISQKGHRSALTASSQVACGVGLSHY